jgi:hypothetical protein
MRKGGRPTFNESIKELKESFRELGRAIADGARRDWRRLVSVWDWLRRRTPKSGGSGRTS